MKLTEITLRCCPKGRSLHIIVEEYQKQQIINPKRFCDNTHNSPTSHTFSVHFSYCVLYIHIYWLMLTDTFIHTHTHTNIVKWWNTTWQLRNLLTWAQPFSLPPLFRSYVNVQCSPHPPLNAQQLLFPIFLFWQINCTSTRDAKSFLFCFVRKMFQSYSIFGERKTIFKMISFQNLKTKLLIFLSK